MLRPFDVRRMTRGCVNRRIVDLHVLEHVPTGKTWIDRVVASKTWWVAKLECGHVVGPCMSQPPSGQLHCRECHQLLQAVS